MGWRGEGVLGWDGPPGEQSSDGYPAGWGAWMNVTTVPAAKNMPLQGHGGLAPPPPRALPVVYIQGTWAFPQSCQVLGY